VPVSTSRGTWTHAFGDLGVYQIRQTVCDSKGQCAQEAKTVTVINRPPTANFDWSPKPVYEGDTIVIVNLSADPDDDSLTYHWTIAGPGGYRQTAHSRDVVIPGADTANRPGTYAVTLAVGDAHGGTHSVTRSIMVHELGIQGMVRHTEAWERNRLRYNEKYPQAERPPDWFWTGEAFELAAKVTDTGESATKAVSVEATAPPSLYKLLSDTGNGLDWTGLLQSRDAGLPLAELPQGPLTFDFSVTYSNGVVKTTQVTVYLKDTVDHYVQVHRVQ
jgi:PKD repeat protein